MIALYQPGTSFLHRLPASAKLVGLLIGSLVTALMPHTAWTIGAALAVTTGLYLIAGLGIRPVLRTTWQLRYFIVILAIFLVVFVSPLAAWINVGRMLAIVLLAGVVTLTTRASELLDVLDRLVRPLRRVGVDAEAVALTLMLTIAFVPVIADFARSFREAERARGVKLGFRMVVPLLVRTLRLADDVGDALRARGIA